MPEPNAITLGIAMINRILAAFIWTGVAIWIVWLVVGLILWVNRQVKSESIFVGLVQVGLRPQVFFRSISPWEFATGVVLGIGYGLFVYFLLIKPFLRL